MTSVTGHDEEKGKTPPNAELMPDSQGMKAERRMQRRFRKSGGVSGGYSSLRAKLVGRGTMRSMVEG
jgi:hypothetical protein